MHWQQILPTVHLYCDSCNVYAITAPGGTVIINAGTGRWLDHVNALPGGPSRPAALLCTHYFRDHSAGACRAADAGIPIYVPHGEREFFVDPAEHFRRRETYIMYDNLWDLFVPIEGVPVAGSLRDHERLTIAGLNVEVIPLPGVTINQVGFGVTLPGGKRVVFCGEAIHSPGRVARIAPLQYNYNDLGGALNCYVSAQTLRDAKPDALLPSLGEPMLSDADGALAKLQENLRYLCRDRPGMTAQMDAVHAPPLIKVTDHVYRSAPGVAHTWFVISKSGKCLALDYGYQLTHFAWSMYSHPYKRRALLHGLDGLKKELGIDRIDVVLPSHFHDDHVCGIPNLQRLFGTQCWVPDVFADLLEHPEAHCFPCNWPDPIRVDRRLKIDEPVKWEEYTFRFAPMSGHTRFAALIGFEADGKRFAHSGDQYFFTPWDAKSFERFDDKGRMQNHVYRNGALLDGYDQSRDWMLSWRPEIVLQGHQAPFFTDEQFFKHLELWTQEYKENHRRAMVLGDDETHFNLDSWGGWIWPYRTHLPAPRPAKVKVTVRNPLPKRAKMRVTLVGPKGWRGETAELSADARAEVSCELSIMPSVACRRQPFAAELEVEGKPYGQVAEALMTVGGEEFESASLRTPDCSLK